jgi:DNA-binding response OmpR family regulator
MGEITVICADPVEARLTNLATGLRTKGFRVIQAESASRCLMLTSRHRPFAVVLDCDLLLVDQEDMAEYVTRTSASTMVFLTVDDPSDWEKRTPYVKAVIKRGAAEVIASLIRGADATQR